MIAAENWLTDPANKARKTEQDVIDWIKQIQLDAFKAGVLWTANLIDTIKPEYSYKECGNDMEMHAQSLGELNMQGKIKLELIAKTNNLTSLPPNLI